MRSPLQDSGGNIVFVSAPCRPQRLQSSTRVIQRSSLRPDQASAPTIKTLRIDVDPSTTKQHLEASSVPPPSTLDPVAQLKWKLQGPPISLTAPFLGVEELYKYLGPSVQSFIWRPVPGKSLYSFRAPAEIAAVLRNPDLFRKSDRIKRVKRFFGESGLPIQHDAAKHKAQKELLSPSFRPEYIRSLIPVFAAKSAEMVDLLLLASDNGRKDVDLQDLALRYTFDAIGSSAFAADFGGLRFFRRSLGHPDPTRPESESGSEAASLMGQDPSDPLEMWRDMIRVCQVNHQSFYASCLLSAFLFSDTQRSKPCSSKIH